MSLFGLRVRKKKYGKRAKRPARRTRLGSHCGLFHEALETRNLLTVTLSPIDGPDTGGVFDVPSGKDLYVPLTATDAGQTVSFTATSSNPDVEVTVLNGNPTLQLTVEGTNSSGQAFSGTLTIQLFENLAPDTVAAIEALVNSGFYDGLTFYRIVPDFVIQGGANGTKSATTFDDEFNVGLTFNSPGLLAMANPGTADSNTSEFFITDIGLPVDNTPQYLNFRHSIFGQLTSGFDLYNQIMDAQGVTSSNSSPTSPVTITSATIITDTQNGVVRISEPNNFTGTADITITASSTDGSSAQQSFTISASPATTTTSEQPLLLAPISDVTTTVNTNVSFQISADDYYGDDVTFSVTGVDTFTGAPVNVTVNVSQTSSTTALVTLVPESFFTGTIQLVAHVDDATANVHDAQQFSLTVTSPVEIGSVTDPINLASADNVSISGTGDAGDTISVVASDGTNTTSAYTTTVAGDGTWSISGIDVTQLVDGTITFTATASNDSGNTGEATATATLDLTAPALDFTTVTNPINLGLASSTTASGTGEVEATISLVATDGTNTTTTYTTTVGANGSWTIDGIDVSTLADGTITYTVKATDAAGNSSEGSLTAEKDTIAPVVELISVTDPVTLANVTSTTASGTGNAGDTVSVVATDGTNTTAAYTTTVGEDGTWTIEGIDVSSLADGTITFTATASDAAGNTADATLTATKTAIAISLVTDPINAANASNTSASGTGQAGATVSLVVSDGTNTTVEYTTVIGEDGTWSIDGIDVSALADGNITYTATATDDLDNTASNSKVVVKDATPPQVTILSVTDPINLSNDTSTFANGSGEAGATISVVASDGTTTTSALSATVGDSGTWSVTGLDTSGLADGTITYTVTATDTAGNTTVVTLTAQKDTVAPEVNIDSVTDPITIASSANVTASGTGEVGAAISLIVTDGTNSTSAYTTTVAGDGTWTIEGIDVSALADGTITYKVTATDAAFNTAEASMTATKATVDVTVVTDPINAANASSVTASGTGEVGATISVVASDGTNSTVAYTTTVASDGTWTIAGIDVSALADGEITFTATATDTSENTAHSSLTATKDTVAPTVAITSVTNPINSSNASTVSASGTGDVGSLVVLTVTDGTNTTTSYSVAVADDGTWQIDNIDVSALADGTLTFTVKSTDTAGNVGQSSITATKSAATNGSLSGFVYVDANGNNVFDDGEVALAGVILTLTGVDAQGNPLASQTVSTGSDGSFSFSSLAAGTYTITQAQPAGLEDGTVAVGTLGGTSGVNSISGIAVDGSTSGTAYNFAESGVASSMISMRLFLASSPSPEQVLKDYATQYGTAAPLVMSIVKTDTDPTDATTVSYTVQFNESVTGVDASDFTTSGIDGASIDSVTGSGSVYSVVVNTGGGSGSLSLKLVDDDSIIRDTSTPLGGVGAGNGDFVGPAYTITSSAPAVAIGSVTDPINAANQSSVTASGTGEVGATITLTATDGTNSTTEYTTTVGSDGTWSISGIDTSGLADGTITFNVTAANTAGNSAQTTLTATKDTVAPTVAIGSVTDPINSDNESSVTASGTGEVGATVSLVGSDGTNSTSTYTATIGSDGTWSITGIDTSGLADGTITFTVTATDTAGNTAQSTLTAIKDTAAPTVTLNEVTDPITIANHTDTQASGTGEVGATVTLTATDGTNTTTEYTTTVAEDGTWSITGIDTSALADGTITFTATAHDTAGNSSQSSLTANKVTVAIVSVTDPINGDSAASVTVTGTGEAGATISLVVTDENDASTTVEYTTTVGEDGTWTIEGVDVSELADGTITFTANAADAEEHTAQTSKTATKDTVAPEVVINNPIDPVNLANAGSVTVTGTGEAGATISLVVTDENDASTTVEYTTTVGEDGTWTIEGIDVGELADGTLTFTATATDAAGNAAETTATAIKDTTVPAVTLDAITVPLTIATYRDLQVGGTGEVGATISVVVSDGTNTTAEYTTTVGENGTWTIESIDTSGLVDGVLTITVTATDGVGNSAEGSTTVSKTTVAIDAFTAPINDAGAAGVTVTGTGEAGATITLTATDGTNTTIEYTTVIGEDGTWTIEGVDVSELADGTITFHATATDANDNTAEAASAATKDSLAPAVGLTSVTNPINAANASATSASGTGEAGATISLVVTDENDASTTVEYTTTVGEDGTWTIEGIDVSELADGTLTFTATATDAAGNTAASTLTSFKDTVAPAIAITNVNSPITIATQDATSASGTGDAGATVTVVASDGTNSTVDYTTTVSEDGTWSIDGIDVSGLADGTITYTATATNSAGNSAQATLDATKTTIAIVAITDPINADSASDVAVSGTGEVGATITLVVTDVNDASTTTEYTTVVGEDGTWTIEGVDVSELADGTLTFTATATDSSDNTAESILTATKDTLAPNVALTSVTDPIDSTNASSVATSGTGDAGATITLVGTDANDASTNVEYTATVGEDGTWTIEGVDVSALADGTLTFTATATDAAGNSAESTLTATKATQAESASVTALIDTAMADEEDWT